MPRTLRPASRLVLLALLGAGSAGCVSDRLPVETAEHSTLSTTLDWEHITLGPNDLVRVGVWGHPELATPLTNQVSGTRVDPEGTLSLPLVGPVPVEGLHVDEARAAITAAYAEYVQEPRVDFSVVEFAARRFYVYGEVAEPGPYVLDRPLNLYQALSMTGGFTGKARRDRIVLLRGGPLDLEVHVFDGEAPDMTGLMAVRPDDFLFVRRSGPGKFSDEILPILIGAASSLNSIASVILIANELEGE